MGLASRTAALVLLACLVECLTARPLAAADASPKEGADRAEWLRAHYVKTEAWIPMRDGARLYTAIYTPTSLSVRPDARSRPILMRRTPYSCNPYGVTRYPDSLAPHEEFERDEYILVEQDVRGAWMSEGEFVNMRPRGSEPASTAKAVDEATDTWDTIEWLLAHVPGHNGRVGQWGISYPGFYATMGILSEHPALVAASPQAPIADWFFDDVHHNGALNLSLTFYFFSLFDGPHPRPTDKSSERLRYGTADAYDFFLRLGRLDQANSRWLKGNARFWDEVMAHPNYDEFWRAKSVSAPIRRSAPRAAILVVGGWFDAEDLYGALETYRAFREAKRKKGSDLYFAMGPWSHGGWRREAGDALGDESFGYPTSSTFQSEVLVPFFEHYLDAGEDPKLAPAWMFETGANRFRGFDAWPPGNTAQVALYLEASDPVTPSLVTAPPSVAQSVQWVSDPHRPVPYTTRISTIWSKDYMSEDQRFAGRRPDVAVFRTAPLEAEWTVAGPVQVELTVESTGTDADWVVKLVDVHAESPPEWISDVESWRDSAQAGSNEQGKQLLVRAEVMPARFRDGFEQPVATPAGEPVRIRLTLPDVFHTFERGHRIMVQVQNTWFPLVARNPQTYLDNPYAAEPDQFRAATQTIHLGGALPSRILLPTLPTATAVRQPR